MEIIENTGIESLVKKRKDLWIKYYLSAINKDISAPYFGWFKTHHHTRQQGNLFVPFIRTNAFFVYSFWPRTW